MFTRAEIETDSGVSEIEIWWSYEPAEEDFPERLIIDEVNFVSGAASQDEIGSVQDDKLIEIVKNEEPDIEY